MTRPMLDPNPQSMQKNSYRALGCWAVLAIWIGAMVSAAWWLSPQPDARKPIVLAIVGGGFLLLWGGLLASIRRKPISKG